MSLIPSASEGLCSLNKLKRMKNPSATKTWQPVSHYFVLKTVLDCLRKRKVEVEDSWHTTACDDTRYFGLLHLKYGEADTEYKTCVGIRNSLDKKFAVGLAWGSQVIVCSNLMFVGEVVVGRRHTPGITEDLPLRVNLGMDQLFAFGDTQKDRIEWLRSVEFLRDYPGIDHILIQAMDKGLISSSMIGRVLAKWRESDEPEGSMWELLNAFTYTLRGSVRTDNLINRTIRLQEEVLLPYCDTIG